MNAVPSMSPEEYAGRVSHYCPSCGRAGVVAGLDSVLLETAPAVRRHACGVGGPGAEVRVMPSSD